MNYSILKTVKFLKRYPLWLIKTWRFIFLSIAFLSLLGFILHWIASLDISFLQVLTEKLPDKNLFLALFYIFFPIGVSIIFFEIFIEFYLKKPPVKEGQEAVDFLDFDSAQVFYEAEKSASKRKRLVFTDDILFALIKHKAAQPLWLRLGINPEDIEKDLKKQIQSLKEPSSPFTKERLKMDKKLLEFINDLGELRKKHKSKRIMIPDLLIALFDNNTFFNSLILKTGLNKNDLEDLGLWYEKRIEYYEKNKRFWDLENILRRSPIGVDWVYGYTAILDRFSIDLTKYFETSKKEVRLIGRKNEIEQIERILSRSGQNNVILVGEPGVGKNTVIYGFAELIAKGKTLPALKYKRMLKLNMAELVSSSNSMQDLESLLLQILKDASRAGNIILFIEDIHNFIGATGGIGKIDISEILKPYLESNNFQLIATTDIGNYHRYIETRGDLKKLFEKVEVQEPDSKTTMKILQTILPNIEEEQGVFLTHQALKNIIDKSETFIQGVPFPEKAIDLLFEVISYVKSKNKTIIMPEDINKIISQKTNIPIGEITVLEKEKIQNLEKIMHQDIVNQETAIKKLTQTLLRLRTGLTKTNKPAGVFLFIGPTGVGKTLTAKTLAKVYFGSENKMIRFDMSEFQNIESIDRFIGSPHTQEPGQFVSKVRDMPFSVILLDELEKAHPKILNLFLQVFSEARLTDIFGKTVSFRHNIIIATSNAGAEYIRNLIKQKIDPAKEKELIIDYLLKQNIFRPEFLNRFDDIIIFHSLNKEQIKQIAKILLNKLSERLKKQNYFLIITDELVNYISEIGFNPQFGARPMQRAIQDTIEVSVSKKILNKEIKKGDKISINIEELKNLNYKN